MKKKLYFLSMLAAGLTLAGCNDDLGDGPGSSGQQIGNAYVKVTLNLPTANTLTTRAANDIYDDGSEYQVKSVALIFFEGTNEKEAPATSVKELEFDIWNDNDVDNDAITSFKEFLIEVKKPESDKNLFALAVLNATVAWDNNNNWATINGKKISTLKDLMTQDEEASLNKYASNSTGFLMLNAPLASTAAASTPGSVIEDGDMTTLVKLTPFDDVNEAATRPADEIYVERAVAKVTVAKSGKWNEDSGSYFMTVDNDGIYKDDKAKLIGWYLNVTNKSTKLGHDIYGVNGTGLDAAYVEWARFENSNANNNQRFYSSNNPRRAYWGIDCNYDKSYSNLTEARKDFNIVKSTATYDAISPNLKPKGGFLSDSEGVYPVYCFENTMNYDKQAQIQTTGIVFVMQYMFDPTRGIETFFTLPTADKAATKLPIYTFETEEGKSTGLADKVNSLLTSASNKVKLKKGAKSLPSGYYRGADGMIQIFVKEDDSELSPDEALQLYNVVGEVALYRNGTTYYYVSRIQHFGDTYCMIDPADVENLDSYDGTHLGRYGVLRNNWYEIDVTGISGPGSPVPPEPTDPGDPDDGTAGYIKANINILSWAKREQDVEL